MAYGLQIINPSNEVLIDSNAYTYPVLATASYSISINTDGELGLGVGWGQNYDEFFLVSLCSEQLRYPSTSRKIFTKPAGLPAGHFGIPILEDNTKVHGCIYRDINSTQFNILDGIEMYPISWRDTSFNFKVVFFAPAGVTGPHSDGYGLDLYDQNGALTFNGSLPQLRLAASYENIALRERDSVLLNLPTPLDNPPVVFITETYKQHYWSIMSIRKAAVMSAGKYTQIRLGCWFGSADSHLPTISNKYRIDVFKY